MPRPFYAPTAGIYAIVNRNNGKLYIGSAVNLNHRWAVHRSELEHKEHGNQYLQKAFSKDPEAFYIEVIEELHEPDKAILLSHEQFWMDFYRCYDSSKGYNIAPKAESCQGIKRSKASAATRAKMSAALKANPPHQRAVLQFDLSGQFIARHRTITEAEEAISGTRLGIAEACQGKVTHAGGFQWKYADQSDGENNIGPQRKRRHKGKPVVQFDLDGNTIREYSSFYEAQRITGISDSAIHQAISRNNGAISGGFKWARKERNA